MVFIYNYRYWQVGFYESLRISEVANSDIEHHPVVVG